MHRFRATIEKGAAAPNSWCFVKVPAEIACALNGARRVTGTMGSRSFDGALLSRGGGQKTVLVTRELRDALRLEPGHEIEVALEPDERIRALQLPAELGAALDRQPDTARLFATLAPSHQREYADWIAQAKKPETRAARVERALAMIAERRHIK